MGLPNKSLSIEFAGFKSISMLIKFDYDYFDL